MTSGAPWADLSRPPLRTVPLRGALVVPAGPLGRIEVEETLGSTSTALAERATADPGVWPDLSVLVAEHQDAGRGRRGRTFTTAPRAALTASVLLRAPAGSAPRLPWLPLLAGLAVVEELRRRAGVQAVLKWPNDVLLPASPGPRADDPRVVGDGHVGGDAAAPAKVCGVLAEVLPPPAGSAATSGPVVVLGLGLNVDARVDELPTGATSLRLAGAATTDRDVLLRSVLRRFVDLYGRWRDLAAEDGAPGAVPGRDLAALTDPVREVCSTLGRRVRVELPGGEVLVGRAEAVDATGALVVRTGGGARLVTAGDVVHLRTVDGGGDGAACAALAR
ncbi:biotin--[acetyl-CoA-carboxylase] ligase [Pseudokineococcus basanitobsidens]|uniref:biotin--[biotin carboxyl-carrier protein] ligase n=1 Tax=Pseudokineococcus basanitobsidens TaxID=1926649 RepID=A0ABU8RL56_9ACTN